MNDIEVMKCGELLLEGVMVGLGADLEWLAVLHRELDGVTVKNKIKADVFNDFRGTLYGRGDGKNKILFQSIF